MADRYEVHHLITYDMSVDMAAFCLYASIAGNDILVIIMMIVMSIVVSTVSADDTAGNSGEFIAMLFT